MRTDGIDIHADDFGESVHASADILDCIRAGKLDSISVLCNMSCFEECVGLYRAMPVEQTAPVKISVHINLMEGSSLTEPGSLPDLTDRQGQAVCAFLPARSEKMEGTAQTGNPRADRGCAGRLSRDGSAADRQPSAHPHDSIGGKSAV